MIRCRGAACVPHCCRVQIGRLLQQAVIFSTTNQQRDKELKILSRLKVLFSNQIKKKIEKHTCHLLEFRPSFVRKLFSFSGPEGPGDSMPRERLEREREESDNSSNGTTGTNSLDATERARMIGQCACAVLLCVACFGAIVMILREAIQGATKSFYCSADGQEPTDSPAPLACAVPLASAAILCNLTVVVGLLCVLRFAWQSGRNMQDGPASLTQLQHYRSKLQKDLNKWRGFSAKAIGKRGLLYFVFVVWRDSIKIRWKPRGKAYFCGHKKWQCRCWLLRDWPIW